MAQNGIGEMFLLEMKELEIPVEGSLVQLRITKTKAIHLLVNEEIPDLPAEWECDGVTYPVEQEIYKPSKGK